MSTTSTKSLRIRTYTGYINTQAIVIGEHVATNTYIAAKGIIGGLWDVDHTEAQEIIMGAIVGTEAIHRTRLCSDGDVTMRLIVDVIETDATEIKDEYAYA